MKKIFSIILCICIMAGALTGCSKNETEKGKKESNGSAAESGDNAGGGGGGAFREEMIQLPVEDTDKVISMIVNGEGNIELYVSGAEGEAAKCFVWKDGSWEEQKADWLAAPAGETIKQVVMGKDKNRYALIFQQEKKYPYVIKEQDGQAVNVIQPSGEAGEGNALKALADDSKLLFYGIDLKVAENGTMVIQGTDVLFLFDSTGERISEIPLPQRDTDSAFPADTQGDKLFTVNEEGTGFAAYQLSDGKKISDFNYDNAKEVKSLIVDESSSIFVVDTKGISHLQADGSLTEVVLDGANYNMGNPTNFIKEAGQMGEMEYAVLYFVQNGTALFRYYFDEEASANPDRKLTIFGLEESSTVKYAINVFRQKYPDVRVEYQTKGSSDSSASDADYIRALNTELLNKNGADILMLDGLPVQSFIEKGVLADMSGMLEGLQTSGDLPESFTKAYQQDNKTYAVPVRYGIPLVMASNPDVLSLCTDLEKLGTWLKDHPDEILFDESDFSQALCALVYLNYDKIFTSGGELDKAVLETCMTLAKEITGREGVIDVKDMKAKSAEIGVYYSSWNMGRVFSIQNNRSQAAFGEMRSLSDMMEPFTILREQDVVYDTIKGFYMPHGIAGINSNAKEPELAEEFIETMLSEEVQKQDLGEGFPCSQKGNEAFLTGAPKDMDEALNGIVVGLYGAEGEEATYTMPLREEAEGFLSKSAQLITPVVMDETVLQMILEEAKLYEDGSETAAEAVDVVVKKAKTRMSE